MGTLTVECDTGKASDGYHTFDELYEHRCLLFIALMRAHPMISWRSCHHADGTMWPGWFIAGMTLSSGRITYHLPVRLWDMLDEAGIDSLDRAPEWDGHTPNDVLDRLRAWVEEQHDGYKVRR